MHLKRIPYQYIAVNLKKGSQLDAEYSSKINGIMQVPTLMIDGHTLTQSVAIMEYLEESRRFSGRRLLPDDPNARDLGSSGSNLRPLNLRDSSRYSMMATDCVNV